ncbi:Retrovirus-related Pol polyprotein from transposon TNT 1-94 [Rhizoctonia solani]|uniref:Retrovirus-related Pol polyprotein from transposon TNT 1-94 n=1 Tax=Rhizoctonia solani TaxID=456999 RepID=A0A8H8P5J9_9AGAM|nr:Retrovirus-related Pol polyprotein from transposon TNT 1-94 [Rhizoctonia solani]QRW23987.1 Retrovirus-related Pol polyprotein from transposon TNT 1-94 [Rhizoctonia solani]
MVDTNPSTSTNNGMSGLHRIPPLRGTDNYNMWRTQMEDILTDLDLYGYVNGTITMPSLTTTTTTPSASGSSGKDAQASTSTGTNEEYLKWSKSDRKALVNIRLRVDGNVLTHIQGCTTSADAWNTLATTFQVKGTVGLINLRRKFFSHRMTDGEDIEEHIQRMRGWFQRINDIKPNSINEANWITTLVASLPDLWDSFTQSKHIEKALGTRTERHFLAQINPYSTDLYAPIQANVDQTSLNPSATTAERLVTGQRSAAAQAAVHTNTVNRTEEINLIDPLQNSKTNDYAFSTFENLRKDFSKSTCTWIADSGTTTHIANDQRLFTDYRKSSDYVTGVAGKEPILGRGTVELWCLIDPEKTEQRKITLTNVAHVPSSPANLISLSLITDKGYCVSMDQDQLLQNRSQGNLWKLNAKTINKVSVNNKHTPTELALVKQTGQTWLDWHKVLGHIGPQALQQIKNTNAVNGMEIVEDNIGLNLNESLAKVTEIGELVVTDVWGPARTPSIGQYKYYVSFTNVATRFTCLGFLQHKDKTLNEYKLFEALLNTQKDKKIKRVRFDNGREFVNNDWIKHAAQRGTILETTAPYSAQQNGIAKQLNQTLTNKAQAMLLESAAPKFLWNEALAYACYLKNQVPTQVHGTFWKTPFEAFWGQKPNVSVLRPWGTKCYVLDQGENQSKLDSKTFTATFVGISDVQGKSWRYYKTGANWILHSRNILFPKDHAAIKDVADNTDWGELVAPPAEGEMTQTDSAAEQPTKPTGTGGAHVVSKNKENDSKLPSNKKPIKSELKTEGTTSNSHTQPIQQPVVPKSNTSCSKPAMRTNPSAVTTQLIQAINALTPGSGDGIQTRSRNPNAPAISLARERGGVKISINDTTPQSGQSAPNILNKVTNLAPTHQHLLLLSAPTIPSKLAFALDAPPTPQSTTSIDGTLADKFGRLQLSNYTPTKPDSPLATTGHLEQSWAALANPSNPNDHPTVEEALAGPQANEWSEAMRKEVSTLKRMGTYKHVEPPKDCKPIGNKWVLTLKRNANGEPERYKARLVAQGFSQQPGINFDKTFAPVVRLDSICSLVSLANNNNWDICQLDVNAAYLHAEVDKELYMRQIPYFEDGTNRVLKLKCSIYGLKQAGRMWNKLYNTKLQSIGYRPVSPTRVSTTALKTTRVSYAYPSLLRMCDDLIVITSTNTTNFAISKLLGEFDMRNLGPIHYFLGIAFKRNHKRGILCLNQTAYINNLVHFAGLKDAFPANTPLSPSVQLTRFNGAKPKFNYGTYIAKGFGKIGYSDANWGSNLIDRKSISGHVFMLGGAAVSWSAKKQATVALSTMEAEYMALSHACTQALWMRQFFEELYLYADAPTLILSDNLAALTLSVKSQFHGRSKHIDIQHHFMRNIIEKRKVTTLYVPSNENLADAFTKALPAPQFRYLMRSIMGEPIEESIEDELIN